MITNTITKFSNHVCTNHRISNEYYNREKDKLAGNRQRDTERTNNNSDSPSTIAGRNPQGEGRSSQ